MEIIPKTSATWKQIIRQGDANNYLGNIFSVKQIPIQSSSKETRTPAWIVLFKINNGNIRTMCEICSKLTIKTQDDVNDFTHCSSVSIVDFEPANAGWAIALF